MSISWTFSFKKVNASGPAISYRQMRLQPFYVETRSFVDLLFTVVRDRSYLTGGSRSAAKASPTTPTSSALSTTTAVPTVHPPPPVAVKEVESRPPQKGPVKLRVSRLKRKGGRQL